MNPTWCRYFLHSLQGQLDEVHFFTFYLKSPYGTDSLISCGTKLKIFDHKRRYIKYLGGGAGGFYKFFRRP